MAEQGRDGKKDIRSGKLRLFFLNKELHRSLHIHRGNDSILTWNYPQRKRIRYSYSETKKRREPAFTLKESAKMLNRGRLALERAIIGGHITEPPYEYSIGGTKEKVAYYLHEDNILEAHAYLGTLHHGNPRKDGLVTPKHLPTVSEVRAMIRQEEVLYRMDKDGNFVPVWRATDF